MRIGITYIAQETNTFSPMLTDVEALCAHGVRHGKEVLRDTHEWSLLPAYRETVGDETLVGITSAHARPAGPLTGEAFETLLDWFSRDLERALPLDGLLLTMHGAFCGQTDPDVEGAVLERARTLCGPQTIIAAAMDLHGNLTRRKFENADIIRCFHTHPHVDGLETARRTAQMLKAALHGRARPVMCGVKIPMITPAETQLSEEGPLRELMDLTRAQEKDPRVLSSSIFAVQPWLDIPEMGWASLVVTDGEPVLAERLARELAGRAWEQRQRYIKPCPTYEEALDDALSSAERPVVVSDFADLMTGGGTGDSTWYLRALLARSPQDPCYLTLVDPDALQKMASAGAGARLTLLLGGKQDRVYSTPVQVSGEVVRILPPTPDRLIPPDVGLVAVFQVGQISIVVLQRLGPGSSPLIYSGAGLDPAQARVMIAKSVVDFREGYKGVARRFLLGEAPGLAPSNLRLLHWNRVPRPIFPLDEPFQWDSGQAPTYS